MLEIWGRNNSVNVQKVLWCCEELELDYQRIDAGGPFGRTDEAGYRAINPTGLVPTLVDGDFTLWESNAIARYLARAYGAGPLLPNEPQDSARIDQWMDWQATALWPRFRPVFIGLVRTPATKRDNDAIAAGVAGTGRLLELLDRQLADRDYVLGARFTLADVALGAPIHRWFSLEIERPTLPNVQAWYDRLRSRETYAQVVTSVPLT